MHESHLPHLFDRSRHGQRLWLRSVQTSAQLDPHIQLQFSVNPIYALMVPQEALHVAQRPKAKTKPQIPLILRHSLHPIGDLDVLGVELGQT